MYPSGQLVAIDFDRVTIDLNLLFSLPCKTRSFLSINLGASDEKSSHLCICFDPWSSRGNQRYAANGRAGKFDSNARSAAAQDHTDAANATRTKRQLAIQTWARLVAARRSSQRGDPGTVYFAK